LFGDGRELVGLASLGHFHFRPVNFPYELFKRLSLVASVHSEFRDLGQFPSSLRDYLLRYGLVAEY
jgi:hypothetical protein